MKMGARAAIVALSLGLGLSLALAACKDLTGNVVPVPPVHRVPPDLEGVVILVGADAEIESKDPIHHQRARQKRVPQDLRASMERALELAGFKVVEDKAAPHALTAKVALAVSEADGKVTQVYRCGLLGDDGGAVVQIDWRWPDGIYVDGNDVYDYATHHVATEITQSREVVLYLRRPKRAPPPPSPDGG